MGNGMVGYEFLLLGFGFGQTEIIIFAIVLFVLFGGAKLPSLMRNIGRSVNEFKAGIREKPDEKIEEEKTRVEAEAEERESRRVEENVPVEK